MCTQECPSRRGLTRRDVEDQLARGNIEAGLHPRSRLILEVQGRLMSVGLESAAQIPAIESLLTVLGDRLRGLEQERDELRRVLLILTEYSATGTNPENQRSDASQPDAEP